MTTKMIFLEKKLTNFEVYNLFPARRENREKRKLSAAATKVRDHVGVLISIKEDELKDMARELEILKSKHERQREELIDARSIIDKDEANRAFVEDAVEKRINYREEALGAKKEKEALSDKASFSFFAPKASSL